MTRRTLLLIAAPVLLSAACATTTPPVRDYRIVAYVRPKTDIPRIGAHKLTHINYAFGLVNELGEAYVKDDAPAHFAQLNALKAQNPRLKILLSIGGWGADGFSDAALTDASREKFARSAVAIVDRYALDGIDLDWEYPGQPGPGIAFRPEDKQNFTLLLAEMRRQLGSRLLTIASAGNEAYFSNTEMGDAHRFLDFINVMAYDFAGSWSEPGHHTPLHRSDTAPDREASIDYINRHIRAGIPPDKLVLGVAFYGRSWRGSAYDVDLPYARIVAEYLTNSDFEQRWDAAANAPFLWNARTSGFVTYDDPQSLRAKARFVKQHGLGGVMYWEHSHDPEERLLDALTAELR